MKKQEKLEKAAKELYFAGVWHCEELDVKQQAELWENLRDALDLEQGTATELGLDG